MAVFHGTNLRLGTLEPVALLSFSAVEASHREWSRQDTIHRISRNSRISVRQESFADLVSCKELTMGIARSP
jgi:hypothetical protein